MPTQVKAALLIEPNQGLQIETMMLADPGPHQVRIKFLATGICHSDLNFVDGAAKHYLPVVLGHEGIGTVVEVGSDVSSVAVGDTVIPFPVPDCGTCELCLSGLTNECESLRFDHDDASRSPLSVEGKAVGVLMKIGSFAEQAVVNEEQVVKVDSRADPVLACCLACGVTTGLGSVFKVAQVRPRSRVAVFGIGGVGLGVIQGARLAGATTIIAIDSNPTKEGIARDAGATHFLDPGAPGFADAVTEIAGRGVDYAFECVGKPALYNVASSILDRRLVGTLVGVGVLPTDSTVTFTPNELRGMRVLRSMMGGAKRADVAEYVRMFVDGRINLDHAVSHRLPLSKINEGIAAIHDGSAMRVVVDYSL
jgi:S-(hydroxymethyl)glutathione dehydrogenase / alcohol dehydrogenase